MTETTLPILIAPDPLLRRKARPVGPGDADAVRDLAQRMLATMYAAPGIGLAAPQVGSALRLVVLDVAPKEAPQPIVMVNPEIIAASRERAVREEGCLSLPGQYADVERPAVVRLRWQDLDGSRREQEAEGLFGVCAQHEIDHLDGVLFVDHLSALKRNMLMRKLSKEMKARAQKAREAAD